MACYGPGMAWPGLALLQTPNTSYDVLQTAGCAGPTTVRPSQDRWSFTGRRTFSTELCTSGWPCFLKAVGERDGREVRGGKVTRISNTAGVLSRPP